MKNTQLYALIVLLLAVAPLTVMAADDEIVETDLLAGTEDVVSGESEELELPVLEEEDEEIVVDEDLAKEDEASE